MANKLIKSIRKKKEQLKFLHIQRTQSFSIPDKPHFDKESTDYFLDALYNCEQYLEYGSGGSTILAATQNKPMVTVDSDPYFLNTVVSKLQKSGHHQPNRQHFLHADIGLTVKWGKPLFTRLTKRRKERWANYSEAPWHATTSRPDLILIDGRFRVACALTSIKYLRNCRFPWQILVDDYNYRGKFRFREIEKFAQLKMMSGRMAVFEKKPDLDIKALESALAKYQKIPT